MGFLCKKKVDIEVVEKMRSMLEAVTNSSLQINKQEGSS